MALDGSLQQVDADFIATANKFVCVSIDMADGWDNPVAVSYGIQSIPAFLILDQYTGKAIAEIPWEGDTGKLKQQLNSAATW